MNAIVGTRHRSHGAAAALRDDLRPRRPATEDPARRATCAPAGKPPMPPFGAGFMPLGARNENPFSWSQPRHRARLLPARQLSRAGQRPSTAAPSWAYSKTPGRKCIPDRRLSPATLLACSSGRYVANGIRRASSPMSVHPAPPARSWWRYFAWPPRAAAGGRQPQHRRSLRRRQLPQRLLRRARRPRSHPPLVRASSRPGPFTTYTQ